MNLGRKCEGHVIISNLITYLTCSSSEASNLSGQKSWLSALPVFTEVEMSIHCKSVCNWVKTGHMSFTDKTPIALDLFGRQFVESEF